MSKDTNKLNGNINNSRLTAAEIQEQQQQQAILNDQILRVQEKYQICNEWETTLRHDKQRLSDIKDEISQHRVKQLEAEAELILQYKKDIKKNENEIAKLTTVQVSLIVQNDAKQKELKEKLAKLESYKAMDLKIAQMYDEIEAFEEKQNKLNNKSK